MRKIIIINKKTFYEFCFVDKAGRQRCAAMKFSSSDVLRFKKMHEAHQSTLGEVKRVLVKYRVPFRVSHRKAHIDYTQYDFVITVGGDGTFLQAARHLTTQPILGVNSDPERSVGKFCAAHKENFEEFFVGVLRQKRKAVELSRISLDTDRVKRTWLVLNDMLICDVNPAAMSRYLLTIGSVSEEQRSSGLWVATASGSTGAIHSCGAIPLRKTSQKILYRPRELYYKLRRQ